MRFEVIKYPLCGWEHEEIDAQSAIPAEMFAAFSDPPALAAIMARQRREHLLEAEEVADDGNSVTEGKS